MGHCTTHLVALLSAGHNWQSFWTHLQKVWQSVFALPALEPSLFAKARKNNLTSLTMGKFYNPPRFCSWQLRDNYLKHLMKSRSAFMRKLKNWNKHRTSGSQKAEETKTNEKRFVVLTEQIDGTAQKMLLYWQELPVFKSVSDGHKT